MKKVWLFIRYRLYTSLLEHSLPKEDERSLNIQEIFKTTIFWMPDICAAYDHYYARAKQHKKWYETKRHLHERTRRITIIHLTLIYKNKFNHESK